MNFKISTVSYFLSAVLAGLVLINYPDRSTALAAEFNLNNQEETVNVELLKSKDVIYLGENHDNPEHHRRQLDIIKQLDRSSESGNVAIALEMFQRPFQSILDRYLAQEISEAQLREQTEYDTRWGFDWEFYAPILRYARQQQTPLIALNTPDKITKKVAETGIDSLQGSDFRYIPLRNEINLDNQEYKQSIQEIYWQHVENGQGNSQDLDNFYAAQVLWDETMADAIALYHQKNPEAQIVVLIGEAHVIKDYAVPSRARRRIKDKHFQDIVELL